MCGCFSQSMTLQDYLALLAEEVEPDIPYAPEPIGRFNVAPGTKVLLLSERDEKLHLDPVIWGYAPGWWGKPQIINEYSKRHLKYLNYYHYYFCAMMHILIMERCNFNTC